MKKKNTGKITSIIRCCRSFTLAVEISCCKKVANAAIKGRTIPVGSGCPKSKGPPIQGI